MSQSQAGRNVLIVVYCPRCDYFLKTAVAGAVGTHGCAKCDGPMEVYVAVEHMAPEVRHAA